MNHSVIAVKTTIQCMRLQGCGVTCMMTVDMNEDESEASGLSAMTMSYELRMIATKMLTSTCSDQPMDQSMHHARTGNSFQSVGYCAVNIET